MNTTDVRRKRNVGRQKEGGQPRGRGPPWQHRIQASDLRLSARNGQEDQVEGPRRRDGLRTTT
ncbi:hypothetical protein CORC01_04531 [Colletotrichum orchidophilum]|uniref:Uncharacterized protein n=1 Tax=Colletotrichum orchidophilum TaxID=1209926 RepID=A0A1G4BFP3_9PEZI|nr:uncharacterized protein CORC01_04531 [Colletotrichum orchidophilum]OHF00123.1 hypothetical protein CORC01_04531 [Colletotrichum orchidophilum]